MAPAGSIDAAMAPVRYRCAACGNVTRFDVVASRRTRAFHHFTLGGDLTIEDEEVLAESVDDVTCRWCASGDAVEVLPPVDVAAETGAERRRAGA